MRKMFLSLALAATLPLAAPAFAAGTSQADGHALITKQIRSDRDAPVADPIERTIVPGSSSEMRLNEFAEEQAVGSGHDLQGARHMATFYGDPSVIVPSSGANF